MWDYRQNLDFETSIKISPLCHKWQTPCWFALKGVEILRYLVENLHPAFQLALSLLLIGFCVMGVISLRRKWKERDMVAMQEIRVAPQPEISPPEEPIVPETPEPAQPDPDEPEQRTTTTGKNQEETRKRQTIKSKIPCLNTKTYKGVGSAKQAQTQGSEKVTPSRRSSASTRSSGIPRPKLPGTVAHVSNQNPGGPRAPRQSDIRSRSTRTNPPSWKL